MNTTKHSHLSIVAHNNLKPYLRNLQLLIQGKMTKAVVGYDVLLINHFIWLDNGFHSFSKHTGRGLFHIQLHLGKDLKMADLWRIVEIINTYSERRIKSNKIYYGKYRSSLCRTQIVIVGFGLNYAHVISTFRMRNKQYQKIFWEFFSSGETLNVLSSDQSKTVPRNRSANFPGAQTKHSLAQSTPKIKSKSVI